ncbi:stage II sporulation protein M [Foetidibacter luteolus]|uniref:stage II sporulation protein M n=1 Tax=Foetidibacter luteolus TaxID=2608880 RepID=UPI00129AD981|nr:stage II sporulation protein M [Foetidibacter luteolus]
MREALFIKKNKDRWEQFSSQPSADTDEMASEFIQLTDDLGYSKTFYPHSKVTRFLNAEAARRYLSIYRNRKEEANRFVRFFKYDLPLTVAKHHYVLLVCFVLFMLFFFVGFYSSKTDERFVRDMMGDGYVNMTEKNIEDGNPFGVYQGGNSTLMWLGIMINNCGVSFKYYAEGILAGIPTLYSMIKEAVRLGAFEYMFYNKGYGSLFFLTVMLHGTLELSAIIIAAAAGVVLGKSWLFPGTLKRLEALKLGAKEGVKIIIGLVPVFVVAAFVEGFITRYYRMPVWLSLPILLLSLFFIIGYFVVYPRNLSKKLRTA